MAYYPLRMITENPVTTEMEKQDKIRADQASQDLQNQANQVSLLKTLKMLPLEYGGAQEDLRGKKQANDFNAEANPIKLRDMGSTADLHGTQAYVAGQTAPSDISRAQSQAREAGANADVAVGTKGAKISEANSNAARAGADAQVAQSTVGARINLAQAQATVAQNSAQYDKEGRWFDLFSKNPQLAIQQAGQYGVPPELLAAAQDQTKAAWMQQAWKTVETQYPGDQNAGLRAAVFEQMVQGAGTNPNPSSAMAVPQGSPAPKTRQDELKEMAQQLKLKPGTRDYVTFIQSDGKTIPGAFTGTGMEQQIQSILLNGDPASPEYLAAYNMMAQPKTKYDITTGQLITETPDMSAYRRPAGLAQTQSAPAQAPGPQPAAAAPQSAAPVVSAPGVTIQQVGTPKGKPPTESEQKSAQLYTRAAQQLPIVDQTWNALSNLGNQAGGMIPVDALRNLATDPEYQRAYNAVYDIASSYLYSVSGAQAPEQEVQRLLTTVLPKIGESQGSITDKLNRIHQMVDSIKIKMQPGAADQVPTPPPATTPPPAQAAPGDQQPMIPQTPQSLSGRVLQWNQGRQQFRDKSTGEIFDANGNKVQ